MRTLLLTPGPLTTSDRTRAAMARDWGSRDGDFLVMSERVRARLLALSGAGAATHVAVPVQGSGTFAVEAAVQTLVPRGAKLLVLVNGAYGRRVAEIARRLGRVVATLEVPEDEAVEPAAVDRALAADPAITDVVLVHLETTSGLLNPLAGVAAVVRAQGRRLLVDAIGSLGAVPIPDGLPFAALVGSANKGLEGVPGLAFVVAERARLAASAGNAAGLSLDLHAQWQGFEREGGQWRFTPPTHAVAALDAALDQLDEEGGVRAREARYRRNCATLVAGMRMLGFDPYLPDALQGPVIATFRAPSGGGWFNFGQLYGYLRERGVVIYPGKLTAEPSFRIGCIGAVDEADMRRVLALVKGFVAAHRRAAQAAAETG